MAPLLQQHPPRSLLLLPLLSLKKAALFFRELLLESKSSVDFFTLAG
jgi:hypothetical protein